MKITTIGQTGITPGLLRVFTYYYGFKILGIFASLFPIWLGYHLFILGVTGKASLSIQSRDVSGQLLNAAPGLFFAVGGIAALITAIFRGVDVEIGPDGEVGMRSSKTKGTIPAPKQPGQR